MVAKSLLHRKILRDQVVSEPAVMTTCATVEMLTSSEKILFPLRVPASQPQVK